MENTNAIIVLSGPVGAGKTTVAKKLVNIWEEPIVCIEGDTFWHFIAKNKKDQSPKDGFIMVMKSMVAAALPYAMDGYQVILDFAVPPWFLRATLKIANFRNVPVDYVVIKPSEKLCMERAANRTEGKVDDYTPFQKLYSSFNEVGQYTISSDTDDVTTIAKRIKDGLQKGIFRVYDY